MHGASVLRTRSEGACEDVEGRCALATRILDVPICVAMRFHMPPKWTDGILRREARRWNDVSDACKGAEETRGRNHGHRSVPLERRNARRVGRTSRGFRATRKIRGEKQEAGVDMVDVRSLPFADARADETARMDAHVCACTCMCRHHQLHASR